MTERPQYHHDPDHGETRYPPDAGSESGGRPGERDPHSRLNTPVGDALGADDDAPTGDPPPAD